MSIVNSEAVLAAVHEHEVEVGLVPDPAELDGLDALRVGQDELVIVVGARHPWTRADCVAPSQLASEPFLTREVGSGTRAAAIQALRGLGIELHPELETNSTEALKRTVINGGFTIMSSGWLGILALPSHIRALVRRLGRQRNRRTRVEALVRVLLEPLGRKRRRELLALLRSR